ncbi:hypothetical protein H0H93_000543 [Arthromyces matolae]|nr:hypothetical protein H0H93_000543 [Arthromyces matolae]
MSSTGRSMRCFKSNPSGTILLKDTWRVASKSPLPECKIYEKLHEYEDPHILDGTTAGDDETDTVDPHHWLSKPHLQNRRHCRITLKHMPCRLDQFTHVRQLITAIRDAAIAHSRAVRVAKVLHHAISVENIMFKVDENGNVFGYLIDWDLSLDLSQTTSGAQFERTGTWQFTAARLLQRPRNKEPLIHDRIDDVESFFHVTNWLALRYTAHFLNGVELAQSLHQTFDSSYVNLETGRTYATHQRSTNLVSGLLLSHPRFANSGIRTVLLSIHLVLHHRYKPLEPAPHTPLLHKQYMRAKDDKEEALRTLDDPNWLSTLLTEFLDNSEIDWESNGGRVDHKLRHW